MALIRIVPQTARGEEGCPVLSEAENLDAWTAANVESLVADGYTRLIVTDYTPTVAFGDKRARRR